MNEDPTEFYDDDGEEEVSEIQAEMNEEIASAPQASSELIERLTQNTAASRYRYALTSLKKNLLPQ